MNSSTEKTDFERRVGRAYNRDFVPAVVGYVALVFGIGWLVDFETAGWWKYAVALTPVLPALWGVRAVARHLGRIDEMQRQVHLGAMAVGFGLAMVTSLTLAFLSMAGLETSRWGPWVIYGAGMAGWGVVGMSRGVRV